MVFRVVSKKQNFKGSGDGGGGLLYMGRIGWYGSVSTHDSQYAVYRVAPFLPDSERKIVSFFPSFPQLEL